MKKLICFLTICLLLAALPVNVFANTDVAAMLEELPSVEQFQAMDADAQLEAYNRTQAAYDAYMALSEEEKAKVENAEETFEALFGYFNTLVAPAGEPAAAAESAIAEEPAAATESTSFASDLLSLVIATVAGILLAKKIVTRRSMR